ncbi:hypothetical protein FD723_40035 (plasmid) [Nostoc sp. C052]|uniref:hypothetical protein n=1 Tax=Nostoc sp. C052 TaxID=2576902 RepID=UPI0015C38EEC|nr:hypothetical protein [Nostoc sp. C052]QLE46404.1 hypothetical protein FD723_40035 [Nostoc sp. C052]
MLAIKNVSHFTGISYYQAQVYGSESVVCGLRDLLSGVSELENYILARHPQDPQDGGKIAKAYWFQAVEEDGIRQIYRVSSTGTGTKKPLVDPKLGSAEYLAPVVIEKMFLSFTHPVKVERIFKNQENYSHLDSVGAVGITQAVLNLLKNQMGSEMFRLTQDGVETFPEICITTINGSKCFRWGTGGGSSSIIPSGYETAMDAAFLSATIAANFFTRSNYRIWRLSQIEKEKNK